MKNIDQGSNSAFNENRGKFERPGSTYSWTIHNRYGFLKGHSKPRNQKEKDNKKQLLKEILIRLIKKEYLKKSERIEFYRNFSLYDKDSMYLFTLFPLRYEISQDLYVDQYRWLIDFLKELYSDPKDSYGSPSELFPEGGPKNIPRIDNVFKEEKYHLSNADPFDLNRIFHTHFEVAEYCDKLKRDGHAPGRIAHFMQKLSEAFIRKGINLK
jgi:hypothetical protein